MTVKDLVNNKTTVHHFKVCTRLIITIRNCYYCLDKNNISSYSCGLYESWVNYLGRMYNYKHHLEDKL